MLMLEPLRKHSFGHKNAVYAPGWHVMGTDGERTVEVDRLLWVRDTESGSWNSRGWNRIGKRVALEHTGLEFKSGLCCLPTDWPWAIPQRMRLLCG